MSNYFDRLCIKIKNGDGIFAVATQTVLHPTFVLFAFPQSTGDFYCTVELILCWKSSLHTLARLCCKAVKHSLFQFTCRTTIMTSFGAFFYKPVKVCVLIFGQSI